MPSIAERQQILEQLHLLAVQDITDLWRDASPLSTEEFRKVIRAAYPELLDPYQVMAADLSAEWYEEAAPELAYQAVTAPLPPAEQLSKSAAWALFANGDAALVRLAGTAQRAVFNAQRETVLLNSNREPGATWARHASANACGFCRVLATRGEVYGSEQAAVRVVGRGKDLTLSERRQRAGGNLPRRPRRLPGGKQTRGNQSLGDKYHDHCRCTAIEVRPTGMYEPPPYVDEWEQQYIDAVRATPGAGKYGAIDIKAVVKHMQSAAT